MSKRSCRLPLKTLSAARTAIAVQQSDRAGPVRQTRDPAPLFELPQQAKNAGFGARMEGHAELLDAWHCSGPREMGFDRVETLTLPRRQACADRAGILGLVHI